MKRLRSRTTLLLCAVVTVSFAGSAMARPAHKSTQSVPAASPYDARSADAQPYPTGEFRPPLSRLPNPAAKVAQRGRHAGDAYGGFTSNSLVSEARKYLGTNPTSRNTLWCGAFMDLVLKRTGHRAAAIWPRPMRATARASRARRSAPLPSCVVAAAAMSASSPVSTRNGNPIIVSGNHNRTVAEAVYPRSRITAYVMPGS